MQEPPVALREHPLKVTIEPSLPPARMDVDRITEVISQLLENAGKYSPLGTPIQITAELRGSEIVTSGPITDQVLTQWIRK